MQILKACMMEDRSQKVVRKFVNGGNLILYATDSDPHALDVVRNPLE